MFVTASAWVESPLQLLCVVEWAFARHQPVRVTPRVGAAQLSETAARLREIGLPDGVSIEAPRALPAFSSDHWVVGDPYSGMVRSSLALRMPQRLTVVDDGSATLGIPAVLSGAASLNRPADSIAARAMSELASSRLRQLDGSGALEVFSYYALSVPSRTPNHFRWLRSRGLSADVPSRVFLGSAAAADGFMTEESYVQTVAGAAPVTYFPHRRQTATALQKIAALDGVQVRKTGLPIELVLAGARGATVMSMPSSAVETLRIVLLGSGSTIDVVNTPVAA